MWDRFRGKKLKCLHVILEIFSTSSYRCLNNFLWFIIQVLMTNKSYSTQQKLQSGFKLGTSTSVASMRRTLYQASFLSASLKSISYMMKVEWHKHGFEPSKDVTWTSMVNFITKTFIQVFLDLSKMLNLREHSWEEPIHTTGHVIIIADKKVAFIVLHFTSFASLNINCTK